ncbi:porin [Burkholderia thailandensis]|uniref:porin n=1 Tax=Burkholderia thailandensis TaxID=57975 RepID=UPI00016A538C|nr:porin [Burkholderia thailandensis]AHI67587.1 gram-negative porin family protein [Burkholderia thailandensis H0587]AIP66438.1 porin [Burkholderia thailandensis]AOI55724.1 porin [Burkholderia thailandensis]AOJ54690.1 porin [Burkholderia thailandensis]AVR29344.1 porin [Burkholderia thailandensis]
MDKRLSALCGLGLVSAGACAQTSVTLYGVADAYIEYATNQTSANGEPAALARMGSGGKSGSRWGIKGMEALGDGWRATFRLESGTNLNNGAGTGAGGFDRSAWIALEHPRWGALRFGRQYTTLFDIMEHYSPTGAYSTLYEPDGAIVGINFRENNVVKYLATAGPLTFEAHYAFSNAPGAFQASAAHGAGIEYTGGALSFAFAYDDVHTPQAGSFAHFRRYAAAAMLTVEATQLIAGVAHGQGGVATPSVVTRYTFWWIGVREAITPVVQLVGALYAQRVLAQNPASAPTARHASGTPQQATLQLNYFVSKTTTLYAAAGYARHAALDFDDYNYGFLHYSLAGGRCGSAGVAVGVRKLF